MRSKSLRHLANAGLELYFSLSREKEVGRTHVQKYAFWSPLVGIFGIASIGAVAQTSPALPPVTEYDGTYAFVSSANVNDSYMTMTARMGACPRGKVVGPLTTVNGQARYSSSKNSPQKVGTVGSRGELAMRLILIQSNAGAVLREITLIGRINDDGTIRARQIGYYCSYDLIWEKVSK